MIILRLLLYLVCVSSIGWSVLVFGGPPIIKRLILGYSDGALIPSGITVSPSLSIGISRLEFIFQNGIAGQQIEGFSRATEIVWSLFGEKPFLEIKLGPSVLKHYAIAENVNIYTPSFQKLDWQNISLMGKIDNLVLNSFSKMNSITFSGDINFIAPEKVMNVNIDAEKFSAKIDSSNYSANSITGYISELNFNAPLREQLILSSFTIKNIIASEPNLTFPEALIELSVDEDARNFKIDLTDVKLSKFGGFIEDLKVTGYFNHFNVLQEIHLVSENGMFFEKSPKFPEIFTRVKKLGDEQYKAQIEGRLGEFELFASDNFIGLLPSGNFVIDLEVDRRASKVTSISKVNFNTLSIGDILGTFELGFGSETLMNLGCAFSDCELSDFNFFYKININDEWLQGSSNCPKGVCKLTEMDHLVRTSNTLNIFTILNQAKVLNPLSSLYLFGVISSGQKINEGHELKFQF